MLLLVSGCAGKPFDRITTGSRNNVLEQTDAQSVYDLLQKTVSEGSDDLKPEERYIGGHTIAITVEKGDKIISYSFMLDTLYVYEKGSSEPKEYKIRKDFYEKEFYPGISRILDKYTPFYYQIQQPCSQLKITAERKGKTVSVPAEEIGRFYMLSEVIGLKYSESEKASSSPDPEFVLTLEDGCVTEKLSFCKNSVVINDRQIDTGDISEITDYVVGLFD